MSYFSLYRKRHDTSIFKSDASTEAPPEKGPHAVFQWLALLLGVLVQPFYAFYKELKSLGSLEEVYTDYYFVIFAVIVSVVAFPTVYRNSFDANRPKWMQLIPVFTAGLGWQTIVDTAVQVATKPEITEKATTVIFLMKNWFLV